MTPPKINHLLAAVVLLFVALFSLAAVGTRPSFFSFVAAAQAPPTPVNGKIAFASRRNPKGIYVMEPDGSNQTLLLAEDNISDGTRTLRFPKNLEWSPDGTKLAFDSGDDASQIFVMNADGTGLKVLTPSGSYPSYSPTWSPDGTRIAFSRYGAVWVMNADGSNKNVLVNRGTDPNWSPDGTKIVFAGFAPENISVREIFVVSSDGAAPPERLTTTTFPGRNIEPAWSPDGQSIAYSRRRGFNGNYHIWVMNADGSNLHPVIISSEDDIAPAWSPDGQKLAFVTLVTPAQIGGLGFEPNAQVCAVNLSDGSRFQLTNDFTGDNYSPAWKALPPPAPNTPVGTNVIVPLGDVTITFDNVIAAGDTTVTAIDPATVAGLLGQYQLFNGSQAFEITTTAIVTGYITVCFNVSPPVADPAAFASLRILHGEGGGFVDRTILPPDSPAPNFGTPPDFLDQTICARVTSLSPFVVAQLVNSNQAPVARARNISVAADNTCSANISPSDVDDGSFDPDSGDIISLSLDPTGPFGLGSHAVTLTATDDHGASSSATATVTVIDNTPPSITGVAVDPPALGPPNHKLVDVTVSYSVTDNCGTPITTLSVTSNEPVNGAGDGNTAPDWEVVDAHHVRLRAERSGRGTGRIYAITITATDSRGNTSSRMVTVRVPHN